MKKNFFLSSSVTDSLTQVTFIFVNHIFVDGGSILTFFTVIQLEFDKEAFSDSFEF